MKRLKAWAVIITKEDFFQPKIPICDIFVGGETKDKLNKLNLKCWAIFTDKEDAEKASKEGTPKGEKTKVVEVKITYNE